MKLLSVNLPGQTQISSSKPEKDTQQPPEPSQKPEKTRNYKYWTLEDDEKLSKLSRELNYDWKTISSHFPQRSFADVEQRWRQRIDPNTKKTSWTKEEDAVLKNLYKRLGGKWKIISGYLPGRLPSSIKNRFYGKIFKQCTKSGITVNEPAASLIEEDDLIESLLDLSDDECGGSRSMSFAGRMSPNSFNFTIE